MTEKAKTSTAGKANTFAAAFLAAQSEFPEIGKDSEANAGSFTYKYASLPSILRAVLPVLHKHGLYLTQRFEDDRLVTSVAGVDAEGRGVVSMLPMPDPRTMKAQDFGKITTYMRRYALTAMLGLAPDDDTDAANVGAPTPAQPPLAAPTPATAHATVAARLIDDEHDLIEAWSIAPLKSRGDALRAVGEFLDALGLAAGDDLYSTAKSALNCVVTERDASP